MIKIFVAFARFLSIPGDMLPPLVTITLRKQSSTLWRRGYISKIDISTLCIPSFHGSVVRRPSAVDDEGVVVAMRDPGQWMMPWQLAIYSYPTI